MLPLIVAAVAAALAPGDFAAPAGAERFAAISLVNATRLPAGLEIAIGSATRRATPLFEQDRVWEPRLDNGYPNVVYDLAGAASPWLLWYGGCGSAMNCRHQFLLYANSSDGKKRPRPPPLPNKHTHTHTNTNTTPSILPRSRFLPAHGTSWVCPGLVWNKPSLGRYDASKYFPAIPKAQAKENNIVMYGGGLGMYKDHHEVDPSKRYKLAGGSPAGCYSSDGSGDCAVATAASPDGINDWKVIQKLAFSKPWRPDCHTNLFYDTVLGEYLMTTRDMTKSGRSIGLGASTTGGSFEFKQPPTIVEIGTGAQQLYSQITFRFYNILLGIAMVLDADDMSKPGSPPPLWLTSTLTGRGAQARPLALPDVLGRRSDRAIWVELGGQGWADRQRIYSRRAGKGPETKPSTVRTSVCDSAEAHPQTGSYDSYVCFAAHQLPSARARRERALVL